MFFFVQLSLEELKDKFEVESKKLKEIEEKIKVLEDADVELNNWWEGIVPVVMEMILAELSKADDAEKTAFPAVEENHYAQIKELILAKEYAVALALVIHKDVDNRQTVYAFFLPCILYSI